LKKFIFLLILYKKKQCYNKLIFLGLKMKIKITSSAFKEGELIPFRYTCDGDNISPQLSWDKPDDRIKSFAIIVDDPDAPGGDFVHWIIYDIPSSVCELSENVTLSKNISSEAKMGTNDFGKNGYGGPCPPSGTHRLLKLMEGHVIESGQLMGKYQRKR
jgi:Raf kinase inhibitor-like YbhB/YbcL family protein